MRSVLRRPLRAMVFIAVATLLPVLSMVDPARAATTSPVASVNFQPDASAVPAGYVKDIGAAYDAARGYGWVRQDSLSSSAHTPLDLTRNTRDRARAGIDPTLNTLIHMQYGDSPPPMSKGVTTPGGWEYAVPVGTYQVTASVGDQPPYDSVNTLRVEGSTAISAFRSTAAAEFANATVTVVVTDGRLTVDAIGGTNTKLNYVRIAKVVDDTTAPTAPTGLTATPGDSQVALTWKASTSGDVAGYRVYRGAALVSGTALVTGIGFVDTTAVNGSAVSYTVVAVDTSGNASAASAPATATAAAFAFKVDFSDQATAAPAGYVADYGQPYAAHTGAPSYGWVQPGTSTPVSLVGNGRNRNPAAADPDLRLATFMHMQKGPSGSWELAVPNGSYAVTVALGESGTAVDSSNWLNIEDQNAVAAFVPTAATRHVTATRTVTVTDGKLTLSATGGTNTKIDYVDVASAPGASTTPSVRASSPANLATGVQPTGSVVEDLRLPAAGVDPATLTTSTVKLATVADGTAVAANVITSGGGDVINLSPTAPLANQTLYRFSVASGVKDLAGNAFAPYSIVFTTGTATTSAGPVAFDKSLASTTSAPFTTMIKGPDGRLYAGTLDGRIFRFPINADGTLGTPLQIDTVRTHATAAGLAGAPARTVIGMAFDPASTASAPILWISDDYEFVGAYDVPDWSSHIAKLTGPNLGTYTDVLTNLPRSVKDHETNSIAFGPDGALYFTQGANNAMGEADSTWGLRPEHLLNAAVLRLDPAKLPTTLPLNVQTSDGGSYNPYAANAPLTLYATGIRNAFDLVWHSNGHLYTPTNGSAAGGNTPATPVAPATLPAACAARPDGAWTGPAAPGITNNGQAETDYVFDVRKGKYYGHPNPTRCEWVLAGGNPTDATDPFQVNAYPVGTLPDRNLDLADIYDAGLHASADGALEYRGNAFGGALNGKLLVVRYSAGQDIETFDVAASGALSNRSTGITGLTGFSQPLDVTEDNATGNLYVSELGASRISLLTPQTSTAPAALSVPSRLIFSTVNGTTSATQQVTLKNTGAQPLVIPAAGISLPAGAPFVLTGLPTLPYTLAGGGSVSFSAAFTPTAAGPVGTTLTVTSNGPTGKVVLRGLGTNGIAGTNEPSLQWVLDTYQIPVNVADPDPSTPGLPTTNPLGDEISAQTLIKAEDDEPVTITPIAAYGRQTPVPPIKFGWYPPATAAGKTQLGTVDGPGAQSLTPAAPVTFDPGATAFGLYTEWPPFANRDVYSEDSLNTFDTAVPHHVRVYPMRNPDGSVVANTLVVATEETTTGQDFQDFVAIVSNVKSATGGGGGTAGKGAATVSNLDGFPAPNRLVFSRIQALADSAQLTHDSSTLRVTNTGTGDLSITGLPITGKFALVSPPTLPVTIAAGDHLDLPVRFTATSTPRANAGTLTVQTDSPSTPTVPVTLAGFWQSRSEGGQEPTTADLAALFGWTTNIPADLDKNGAVVAQGDEVLSPYWVRADTSKPVTVKQLQAYHTYPNGGTVKWFQQGGSAVSLYNINGHYAQSILPLNPSNQVATADFTPSATTPFGFAVDGEYSDNTKNKSGPDVTNGCVAPCGHHVLFFPVKNSAGTLVPNTYYLVMDYSSINYDYNDNGYLLTNIKPAG